MRFKLVKSYLGVVSSFLSLDNSSESIQLVFLCITHTLMNTIIDLSWISVPINNFAENVMHNIKNSSNATYIYSSHY